VRLDGTTAAIAIEGATDTEVFRAYVQEVLVPTLRSGDLVVMDNLAPHKNEQPIALIRQVGAEAVFLPPYSPDLNPIEMMWSKIKALLRCRWSEPTKNSWSLRLRDWRPSPPPMPAVGLPHTAIAVFKML
jgi:transposase